MARTKSIPMRRKAAAGGTRTLVSGASLNTRIYRILNASQEMKVYYGDVAYAQTAVSAAWLWYVNPVSGIVQGTSAAQRLGDSIKVFKIVANAVVYNTGGDMAALDFSTRLTLLKTPDTLLNSSSGATYTGRYVGSGFVSNGELDHMQNTILADRKFYRALTYSPKTGSTLRFPYTMTKTFGTGGHKIEFQAGGSTSQANKNMILVNAGDVPQDLTAVSDCTIYMSFSVYYRDA